jgi:hypothetical protein
MSWRWRFSSFYGKINLTMKENETLILFHFFFRKWRTCMVQSTKPTIFLVKDNGSIIIKPRRATAFCFFFWKKKLRLSDFYPGQYFGFLTRSADRYFLGGTPPRPP